MPLVTVVVVLVVVGVLLWLVNSYIPMDSKIKSILNAVVESRSFCGCCRSSVCSQISPTSTSGASSRCYSLRRPVMKSFLASILTVTLLAASAANAQNVGAGVQVGGVGAGANVGTNGVGAGAHVGAAGAGVGVGVSHYYPHHYCHGWYWRHHHHYCRRW